jgi:hypothetical protein
MSQVYGRDHEKFHNIDNSDAWNQVRLIKSSSRAFPDYINLLLFSESHDWLQHSCFQSGGHTLNFVQGLAILINILKYFSQFLQEFGRSYLKLNHSRSLPHPFQFIVHS